MPSQVSDLLGLLAFRPQALRWEDRCHPRRHPCRSLAGLDDTIRGWICVTRLVRLHGIQVAIGLGQLLRCLQISLFHNWFHIIKQAESIVDCCGFGCCRRLDDKLSSFECLKSVCNCSRGWSFCSRLLNFCSLFLLYQRISSPIQLPLVCPI